MLAPQIAEETTATNGRGHRWRRPASGNAFDDLLEQLLMQATYMRQNFLQGATRGGGSTTLLSACLQDFFYDILASAVLLHGWAPYINGAFT